MFTHTVNCPYCNQAIPHNWAEYVTDSDIIDPDRGMGPETEHTIECNDFECPNCKKIFRVYGSVFEYPEGAYNDHELHTEKID